jgi:REP element-mobilizing transposase RayT
VSRRLRFLPEEGTLVEVTCRTVHGRYLLLPSPLRDEILIGALARALAKHGTRCIGFAFMSSHYHLLLEVDSTLQLTRLMNYFNSKVAREIGRLTGWRDKIWSRRYQAIPVSKEDVAQIARLRYILSHGVKENLVERLRDWPGVHLVRALLDRVTLEGRWFNRTLEYAARRRGEKHDRLKYSTPETLTLEPLPCWKHLEPEQRRKLIAALVKEIEDEAAAARKRDGVQVAGVNAVLAHHPHDCPEKLKKGPAPLFHAATAEMRKFLWSLYAEFVARFRDAAEKVRGGDLKVVFPPGCFPPALPYVPG